MGSYVNKNAAANRRLAQWRVTWLIEHSTSNQLLWSIDSLVLRNPPLRQAPNRYPHAIFPTRVACLPPSNWADKKACKMSIASSSLMKRAGKDKMFASLC
jgi:hypothetical protein